VPGSDAGVFPRFLTVSTTFPPFFFLLGFLYSFRRRDVTRLRRIVITGLLAALAGMFFNLGTDERTGGPISGNNLIILFLPLVLLYGVAFFYLLLDRLSFKMQLIKVGVISLFVLLNITPLFYTLLQAQRSTFPYPPYLTPLAQTVGKWFDKDEVGASDLPWAMAWNGDRRTLWLPTTQEDYTDIDITVVPKSIKFLMLTPYILNGHFQSELLKGEYKVWAAMVRGVVDKTFPLKAVTALPPDGEQVIFADRPRWLNPSKEELELKQKLDTPPPTNAPPAKTRSNPGR
jgi:hypothetical protein